MREKANLSISDEELWIKNVAAWVEKAVPPGYAFALLLTRMDEPEDTIDTMAHTHWASNLPQQDALDWISAFSSDSKEQ